MHKKIYPAALAMAIAMASGRNPYFDVVKPMMTEIVVAMSVLEE